MGDYNSRYKRNDTEEQYLNDSNEIENFKQQQAQDVIDNLMLGDFNSEGHYVVDKSIINELINTTKVITDVYGDFRFCQSTKKFDGIGHIQFAVDFSSNPENGQAVAVLVLLESMKACNGFIDNTNGVSIARFVGNNDKYFVERALKYFYVFLPDEIEGATLIENDRDARFTNILARLYYLKSIKSLSDPFINRIEKDTYKKKAKTLNENKKGKEVIDDFIEEKTSVADKFLDKEKDDYFKMLNTLLDKAIAKHEGKVKDDEELSTSLKDIDNTKRINSKKAIDYSERETVENNLSQNAEEVYTKKKKVKDSKGTSPVAVYKEPKKSYQEIENNEKMELDQRDLAKDKAKAMGPKLFGKKEKYSEPKLDENKQTAVEQDGKQIPTKLASKPSYLKNDRYEEIKNSEMKGDKLSRNPTPYSKGNRIEEVDSRENGNIEQNTNQNATKLSDKEMLLRDLLNKDNNSQKNASQQAQAQAQMNNVQTQTQINAQTKPSIQGKTQQVSSATKNQATSQQTTTQQNTQTQTNNYTPNGYPPYPNDPRYYGQYPGGRPPYGFGPNPYGPNPYGPHPYGPGPYPYGHGPQGMENDAFGMAVDLITAGLGINPTNEPRGMGPIPPGPMGGPGKPMVGTTMAEGRPFGEGKDFGPMLEPKGPQAGPIMTGGEEVNVIVTTPGLQVDKPHHIDAHPIINGEDIIKEIFGKDIYDVERPQVIHQGPQFNQGKQDEDDEEFAKVHAFVKH
ncbi:MAG: hypothetical protein IJW82_02600 [Clostridia bacterium]|nr:hypothetical protein [Clostridia bacterium]